MRAIYQLRESLEGICEMADGEIAKNAAIIREVAHDAYCHLGYYRQAKETVHRQGKTAHKLKTRIKALEEQLVTARRQLDQAKQERDAWKRREEAAERELEDKCWCCANAENVELVPGHTLYTCDEMKAEGAIAGTGLSKKCGRWKWRGPCAENGGVEDGI